MLGKPLVSALVLALALPGAALACENEKEHAAGRHTVKSLTVEQLAALRKAKKATAVDASPEPFRQEQGHQARLLLRQHPVQARLLSRPARRRRRLQRRQRAARRPAGLEEGGPAHIHFCGITVKAW
jgi:hypothetical protein